MSAVPAALKRRGRQIWRETTAAFGAVGLELDAAEQAFLTEACRTADRLDDLDETVRREGLILEDRFGQPRTNPAAIEARSQAVAFARLVAALRVPDEGAPGRPQRRGGARGIHTGTGAAARNRRAGKTG